MASLAGTRTGHAVAGHQPNAVAMPSRNSSTVPLVCHELSRKIRNGGDLRIGQPKRDLLHRDAVAPAAFAEGLELRSQVLAVLAADPRVQDGNSGSGRPVTAGTGRDRLFRDAGAINALS